MLIKTNDVYDQAADAERLISKRSPAAQQAFLEAREHRNEAVAKVRKQKGRASHAIHAGKWTERWYWNKDGTKVHLKRGDDGKITRTEMPRSTRGMEVLE